MVTNYKRIEDSALKLEEKDRAELAKRLLKSLEDKVDEDIEQAWIEEINRRKKEIESGEVDTIPAEKVLAEARKILKK
ncbi:addiction module protein [Fodinibius halophilus]|uniref:Addiction module protein n=1 Tax=Fodinibius halophilus TaxID=1736908 RepID=A0A6M1T4A2_9BACT|nr:addiction module protein [Fodinibius halophilus]NGP90236.1 addiction module protein [Fodinibius halophilus]